MKQVRYNKTSIIFASIAEAARQTGISYSVIKQSCETRHELGTEAPPFSYVRPVFGFICDQTFQRFTRQSKAATTLNLNPTQLSQHLNGKRDHVNGYTFTRLTANYVQPVFPACMVQPKLTATAAAKALGISRPTYYRRLKNA